MILVWGKVSSCRVPNLGCKGEESPGWFIGGITWWFLKTLCTRHDAWAGVLLWWSCQSPVAHSCGLLNHPNCFHTGRFKLNAKFDADYFIYSLILKTMATQYTCSLKSVYHPHWLVQWSPHCSCLCIPVHSPWLPGYIHVVQTILVILTMDGHFLGRPYISTFFLSPIFRIFFSNTDRIVCFNMGFFL